MIDSTERRTIDTVDGIKASLILAAMMLCCQGCDDGRPTRVPVSGRVKIDGQPLKYGRVQFVPDDARPSQGKLDEQGRFTLTCFDSADGAVLGKHRIEVDASEGLNASQVRWHAPMKYAQYNTSGLEQVIDGPTESIEINLTWDGGKPFVAGPSPGAETDRPPVPVPPR